MLAALVHRPAAAFKLAVWATAEPFKAMQQLCACPTREAVARLKTHPIEAASPTRAAHHWPASTAPCTSPAQHAVTACHASPAHPRLQQGEEEEGAKSPTTAALLKVPAGLLACSCPALPALLRCFQQPAGACPRTPPALQPCGSSVPPSLPFLSAAPLLPLALPLLQDDLSDDEEEYAVRAPAARIEQAQTSSAQPSGVLRPAKEWAA